MLPNRRQVLAQREQPVALLVAERDATARQCGALRCHRRDMDEGVMPAPFSFSCHETVGQDRPDHSAVWPAGPRNAPSPRLILRPAAACHEPSRPRSSARNAAWTPAGWRASNTAAVTT